MKHLNEKIYKALNEQVKNEFSSSFIYLSMASYFDNIPLDGFYKWFRNQAREEHEHAMKIYDYILERNMPVDLQAIEKPPTEFKSIEQVFEMALKHEQKVTHWISQIYEMAFHEKDYGTHVFLEWFITEQLEEEKNATDNLDQIRLIGDDKSALLVLDQNFAKKVAAGI